MNSASSDTARLDEASPIVACCGYRCDLCPAFRANIHGLEDQQRTSDGWFRYYGFRIPAEQIGCDGCRAEGPDVRRTDERCPVRRCAIARNCDTCASCLDFACDHLQSRTVTRASVEARLGAQLPLEDYRRFVLPYEGRRRLDRMR